MAEPLLATLPELATLTKLPQSDPRLAQALRRASNRFLADTNRTALLVGSYQERHNGDGGPTTLLRAAPVVVIDSVTIDGTLLAASEYSVDFDAGILRHPYHRADSNQLGGILVTYTAGFATVPGDVEDAVLEHAATLAMVLVHIQQESAGNTQATYGKEATVGTTAKWVAAVAKYNLGARA